MNLGAIVCMNEARKGGDYVKALYYCDLMLAGTSYMPSIDKLLEDRMEIMQLMLPTPQPVESGFD